MVDFERELKDLQELDEYLQELSIEELRDEYKDLNSRLAEVTFDYETLIQQNSDSEDIWIKRLCQMEKHYNKVIRICEKYIILLERDNDKSK